MSAIRAQSSKAVGLHSARFGQILPRVRTTARGDLALRLAVAECPQFCAPIDNIHCQHKSWFTWRGPVGHSSPVENVWQYLRQNWISNTVFENYDAIVDAACDAWRKLIAKPETITSIGMRDWAHIGQSL
jgi:hypothetical protein